MHARLLHFCMLTIAVVRSPHRGRTKGAPLLKRLVIALAITIGLMAPATLVAAPAQAATRTCVTDYMFRQKILDGDYRTTVHTKFSGYVGRFLTDVREGPRYDTWRTYKSCMYPDDDLWLNFDDYSYGSPTRGGAMRLFERSWLHYCNDYEELYDAVGYNYGFECFDRYWRDVVFYDEFDARSGADKPTPRADALPRKAKVVIERLK